MKNFFTTVLFLVFFIGLASTQVAFAQCPSVALVVTKTHTDVTCNGANNGTITVDLGAGNGTPPFNFELYDNNIGGFVTLSVTRTVGPPNKVVFSNVYPSSFQVVVFRAGCPSIQIAEGPTGTIVAEPPALTATATVTPACTPGTGAISLTVNGGTPSGVPPPYHFVWSGPTPIGDQQSANNLAAGVYNVTVSDANSCTFPINGIFVPITSTASAGPNQDVCGLVATLAGNPFVAGETGTWSVVIGTGSFADVNDPATVVSGLTLGANVLRWTITDNGGTCTGTSDDVIINTNDPATVDAGVDQIVCSAGSVTLAGSIGGSAASATWSGGAGTFAPNATTLNAVYTPTAGEVGAGTVTLTLTTNDPAGPCLAVNDQMTITINAASTAGAGPDQIICQGSSATLAGTIGGSATIGTWSGGAGTFAPNATTLNAVYTPTPGEVTAGTVTLTLTADDPGPCPPVTDQMIITFHPLPVAVITSSPAAICAGQGNATLTFTLSGGGPTYNVIYSDGVGFFNLSGISTGHTVVVSPPATTSYSVITITDATTGCDGASGSLTTVTVNSPPTSATLTLPGPNPICAGQNTFLRVDIVGGTGPYNFTIPGLPPQVGYATGTNITVSPAVTSAFILAGATVTDSKGCTVAGAGGVLVVVNPLPTAVLSASPATICAGSGSATLTFTMTGTPPFDVQYSTGAGTASFSTAAFTHNVVVAPLLTTLYSITSISDANPCVGIAGSNVTVTVNTPPSNATLSGTNSICAGTSTDLSVVITGGLAPYTVTINNGVPVQNSYASGSAIAVSPAATTTYSLVSVLDANGCPAQVLSGSAIVTVNSSPTSGVLSGTSTICTGGPANLIVTITGGTAPYSFTINNGVGLQSGYISGTLISVNPIVTTTYSIAGNVTDANGCFVAGSGSATITVNSPPSNATLSGTTSICSGAATDLSVVITGGTAPFTVTINNGVPVQNNYASGSAISVAPVATTTYSLISVLDANGCPAQVLGGSAIVTVNTGPTSGVLSGTNTICSGVSTDLIVTIVGGTAPYSFTINNGVGLQSGYTSGTAISVSPVTTTTYSIAGNVTDANGCSVAGSGSATVTVNPSPTNATLSGSNTICTGNATDLSVVITGGTSPYTVTINNGVPVQNNYLSGSAISVSPAATTTYNVVAVTDANGCPALVLGGSATVTVNPGPTSGILSGNNAICSGGSTNLIVTMTGGTAPYSFTIDNGVGLISGYISGTAISVTPIATTTYSIAGNVTDAIGCTVAGTGNAFVTVSSLANAVLTGNSTICVGQTANLTVDFTTGASPWSIVYTDGIGTTSLTNINTTPFVFTVAPNPIVTTTYSLVSVSNACGPGTVSGSATVTVNPIVGNQATFGVDTWLGYVYDDAGDPTPLPARIDFNNAKYRGVIDENDIAGMSAFSSYNTVTDAFDLNISNNASGFTIHSPNVCSSYNDNFSIRYRMRKTFAQGVYTFTVGSDDGVRLFLDGTDITPGAFVNQSYTTYTSSAQCISAGQHDLVIEYYENTGFARLTFDYQLAPAPVVFSPVDVCVNSATPTLTAFTADPGAIGFNWYKDAALTTLLFSGFNFTPLAADLDMTVAGTTSFFVTAAFVCGETAAAQIDVNVLNSAVITPPVAPTQICQSGGIVDLSTLVSAVPAGGTFTFSGTGVTTSPNFDPTLVAGITTITADYTLGSCTASLNFNLDVVTVATITLPPSPVALCQTNGPIDMTTLVSATPPGGTFTFTGAGVAGNNFDPSAQSGAVPITVDYDAGGCTDSQTLTFNVTATATLTISNTTVCPAAGTVDLLTLVSAVPAGGTFTFSGSSVAGNNFDPSTHAGSIVTINVDYDQGGCTDSGTISVTVRNAADPLCGGGGINCSVFNVTVTDTRPSCTNQNDGVINVNVTGGIPNYVVTLSDGGSFNQALVGPGPFFTYTNLSPANYTYTIQDGGGNICTLPHSLPISGTVLATASNFIDALCFDQPVGGATVTVNSGGAAPYEYSIDGGTTWIVFTSPVAINNLMPSPAPYSILVRDDAADVCPAQVVVTIGNVPAADIVAPYAASPATCANNDGSIQIGVITGGTPPYSFVFDGVNFATLPAANTFTALAGGVHSFTVVDANNCNKVFPILVTFPGLVNFTTTAINPDCAGNGTNGQLIVTVTSVGTFQVGISTDPLTPPASFQNIVSAGASIVTFNNLSKGNYYINATSVGAQCPTVTPATLGAGPVAVDFSLTADDILCFENQGGVTLKSIVGSPGIGYTYQILNLGNVVQSGAITTLQAVTDVPLTGLNKGDYQIQLTQDQSTTSGCVAPITSAFKPFTVNGPNSALDTLSVGMTISLPDVATGSMLITVKESGQEPYEVRLELIQSLFPSQFYLLDWTAAGRNPQNLKIEYNATNLFAGQYKLSLRDALGCEKEYNLTLNVDTDVFIPNIFTPNGDGVNDVFFIRNLPTETNVIITNRWGKEVYRSGDYKNDWTGGNSDDGIYYYRISAGGQNFTGWLEIQRALGQP